MLKKIAFYGQLTDDAVKVIDLGLGPSRATFKEAGEVFKGLAFPLIDLGDMNAVPGG